MTDPVAVDAGSVWPDDVEDVEEGVLATWFLREGASVEEGELLCEIQIEKVSVEVPTPVGGTLASILVAEGETFSRGSPLAEIEPG